MATQYIATHFASELVMGRYNKTPQLGKNYPSTNSYITWVSWHLHPLATQLFVTQLVPANHIENIKALHYWPFVRGIHQLLVDSPHKGPVILSHYWPFVRRIHQLLVDSPHKGPVNWSPVDSPHKRPVNRSPVDSPHKGPVNLSPVDTPHKGPVMWKAPPYHRIIMTCICASCGSCNCHV